MLPSIVVIGGVAIASALTDCIELQTNVCGLASRTSVPRSIVRGVVVAPGVACSR